MIEKLKKIAFWNKLKAICLSLGVGTEVTLHLADSVTEWRIVAAIATIMAMLISHLFEDKDNDGDVDMLEPKP